MAKKVKNNEWLIFGSVLCIAVIMLFADIISQPMSCLMLVAFSCALLFKNYFIEDATRFSFDTKVDFEQHEKLIESLNFKRWTSLFYLIVFITFFRVIDVTGRFSFDSSNALLLLMFGLAFIFRKEIVEYIDYFKGRKVVKSLEETELEIISSVYSSRAIFILIALAMGMIFVTSLALIDSLSALFVYVFIVGMVLYFYRGLFDYDVDNIYSNMVGSLNPRETRRRRGCAYV
ncbi:MAG: hypothetical protein PHW52_01000 [Candidatus Pacebacteria bacterium]|nr:hypothetical protein [Candidatus Paceibacterota bacterium]